MSANEQILSEVRLPPVSVMSRSSRVATGASLALFGIIAALTVIEGGFRLFGPRPPVRWNDRPARYYVPENAETLQDYPHAPAKPEGVYRIAVVGDSFSFAPYMQFDDAFPKRLERWLNLNTSSRKVEVINYGVPRYSTSHEVKVVQQALSEGADFILLQITLNDPEIKPYWPTSLLVDQATGEVKLAHPIFRYWKSLGYVVSRIVATRTRREYRDYFFGLFRNPRTWNSFKASVKKIKSLCKAKHQPMAAVVFPLFGYPVDEHYPFFSIHEQVAGFLNHQKIPSLDLAESYRNLPLDRLQVIPEGDRHPNEIAHRIAAEKILEWLAEKKLIPQDFIPRRSVEQRIGL